MGVLVLLRHGQASLGTANYDELSELGRRQARVAADRLAGADLDIDRVVGGTLTRQRDTAVAALTALGHTEDELLVDARLDEYDHAGVLAAHSTDVSFETATTAGGNHAVQSALDEAIVRWTAGDGSYVESHDEFTGRVLEVVAHLAARPGVTLAVTSGGVIAVACAHLLGLPAQQWPALARVSVNTGMTKILSGRSGTSLVSFNDHAHLEHERHLITYR